MDVDTLLAEHDPARRHPLPGPDSAAAAALYARIVGHQVPAPRRRSTLVISGITVAGLAAAAAVVAVAAQPQPQPQPSGTVHHLSSNTPTIYAHLTATQVLDKAAAAALAGPDTRPRGDQFVYSKVVSQGRTTQSWLSVDGSRDGLVKGYFEGAAGTTTLLGCKDGKHQIRLPGYNGKPYHSGSNKPSVKRVPLDGPLVTESCIAQPAFFAAMPSTVKAMPAYLSGVQGIRLNDLNDLAKTTGEIIESDYLLPAQRAALYEFLATTPGLTVTQSVHDIVGRTGVGIGWSFGGTRAALIFDHRSFTLLGLTTWDQQGQPGGEAVLTQPTVVDQAGQQP